MLIIGCDYHPSGQQVFGIDKESGEVFADRWIAHTGNELDEFYSALPAGTVVGVESSGNMLWFERRLAQYGHQLRLGDAAKIRAKETRKQKHDRRDAELMARLLMEDSFPDLRWVPSLAERDQRQLLMHRHKLVRMRAQVKNQLQHIAMNQGQQKKRQLWSKSGRELLEKLQLDPWTARRRNDLLRWLDLLNSDCESLEMAVQQAAARAEARLLMSHPGIGPVISLAFVLTIGRIERFERSRQLVSYLGLNPSEESSGERRRLGGISKQGSSFADYTGVRIRTPQIEVYVLGKTAGSVVIVIYAPDPSVMPTAERLAGNVGNAGGLNDYPGVTDSVGSLPATLPAGLELVELRTYSAADLGLSPQQIGQSLGGQLGNSGELASQAQRFMPETLVTARYRDARRKEFNVLVGEYGNTLAAWRTWSLLRWTAGLTGMTSIPVGDASGLTITQGGQEYVVFQTGSHHLAVLAGPDEPAGARVLQLAQKPSSFS